MSFIQGVLMGAVISVTTDFSIMTWQWWVLVVASSVLTETRVIIEKNRQ